MPTAFFCKPLPNLKADQHVKGYIAMYPYRSIIRDDYNLIKYLAN